MAEIFGFDAYAPKEIAERVETIGVAKARLPLFTQVILGVLAGGFIGLGALYFTDGGVGLLFRLPPFGCTIIDIVDSSH